MSSSDAGVFLPFDTTFYDTLYLSISSVLRASFPQGTDEDLLSWHRRLLYEFVQYLQNKYEAADNTNSKIPANAKNNKKKTTTGADITDFTPTDTLVFDANLEKAIDLVSQDSNFAVYLVAWWWPIITSPFDPVTISIAIDSTSTLAETVKLQRMQFSVSWTVFQLLSIDDMSVSDATLNLSTTHGQKWHAMIIDPFVDSMLRQLYRVSTREKRDVPLTLSEIKMASKIVDPGGEVPNWTNPYANTGRIATILCRLKNIVEPLFISEISLSSALLSTVSGSSGTTGSGAAGMTVSKVPGDKLASQRKRFNSRKFIDTSMATAEDMAAGVLQSLVLSLFRTFYDYDEATIDPALFDYLFLDKLNIQL